jgi:hypothetical protein
MKKIITIALLFMILSFLGCAKQVETIPIRKHPLPSGEVVSIAQHIGVTSYRLKISNLLPPADLDSQAAVYILWVTTTQSSQVEKAAQFSGAIKGTKTIDVETSISNPRFIITAESGPNAVSPGPLTIIKEFYTPSNLTERLSSPVQ